MSTAQQTTANTPAGKEGVMIQSRITVLYERLSKDDIRQGDSVSIENQKQMLDVYATINGFRNIRHFCDDGITGTVFDRPGLNAMVEEAVCDRRIPECGVVVCTATGAVLNAALAFVLPYPCVKGSGKAADMPQRVN